GAQEQAFEAQAGKIHSDRKPKISQLDRSISGEPHIPRLQIAVHDALRVRVLQGLAHLLSNSQHLADGQATTGRALSERVERTPIDELSHDVGVPLLLANIKHADDVRMVSEAGESPRLTLEPREGLVVEVRHLEHGDHDIAFETSIGRAVHALLAALAELSPDDITSPGVTRRDYRRTRVSSQRQRSNGFVILVQFGHDEGLSSVSQGSARRLLRFPNVPELRDYAPFERAAKYESSTLL